MVMAYGFEHSRKSDVLGAQVYRKRRQSKYDGLFDAAESLEDGTVLSKDFPSKDDARSFYGTLRQTLQRIKRTYGEHELVSVHLHGTTVFLERGDGDAESG